jgi:hypothetical protein
MTITKAYTVSSLVFSIALPIMALNVFFYHFTLGWFVFGLCGLFVLSEIFAGLYRYRQAGHFASVTLRSVLFSLSWISVFFWLSDFQVALLYCLVSVPIFFTARMLMGFGNETVTSAHTILTGLGLSVLPFALEQYFSLNSGLLTLIVFTWQILLAFATFDFTPQTFGRKFFYALVLALLGTEVYVGLLFLPFHFTALGLLQLLGFYWLWVLTFQHLAGVLTRKKIQFYSMLSLALAIFIIILTPWSPL